MPKPGKKLTAYYASRLTKALEEGYGQKIGAIDYDSPDGNMLEHLVKNVYQFSAAKNYTQLRQLTQALIGEDGKLRTLSQFKKAAYEINDTHVNQWLEAEYDLAVSGAQMASKWVDISTNPGTRFLEFDVVLDSRTSDICRPLHGIIVPVDHPMLATYYPPNHFRCRTTVRQHHSATPTPEHQLELPDIPPMFQTNLAKQKLIFPPGHAYWTGVPASVLKEALEMAPLDSWLPVENGTIRIHSRVNTSAKDFQTVMEVARDMAQEGRKIDLLPTLDHPGDDLYKTLFKGAKPGKCPDLRVDAKTFVEVKQVTKNRVNTIGHAIGHASGQADRVIITLPGKQEYKTLKRIAKGRFGLHQDLQVIEFKMEGAYYRFTRKGQLK